MKNWYEMDIKERCKKVYEKTSIKEFWEWWSDGGNEYMEIRFKEYSDAKKCARKYNIPSHSTSVFVKTPTEIINIIKEVKHTSTLWFGINPRRKLRDKRGNFKFTGKDINVKKIKFLFVDIDRVVTEGPATKQDLMNADLMAEEILNKLDEGGFANNYCKICSGNGVHLLVKLDVPIKIPKPSYNEEGEMYIEDGLFKDAKKVIHKGIGKVLPKFSDKFKDEYGVEIDSACFNMGRVSALPYSYNLKYENPIPRGIIELENNGKNEGFSDYLRNIYNSKKRKKKVKKNFDDIEPIDLDEKYQARKNELRKNVIVDLFLNYEFPDGYINNTLWFSLKILLHESGITRQDSEYIKIHEKMKKLHDRTFTENGLEKEYQGNYKGPIKKHHINIVPYTVNKYLRMDKIRCRETGKLGYHKPVFPVSPKGKNKYGLTIDISPKLMYNEPTDNYELNDTKSDPLDDIRDFAKDLYKIRRGDNVADEFMNDDFEFTSVGKVIVRDKMNKMFINFLHSFKEKWGLKRTAYMMRYYMDDYLNYKRWY